MASSIKHNPGDPFPPYAEGCGERRVDLNTASDLLLEITACIASGGDLVLTTAYADPRPRYYLRHGSYYCGIRPLKHALVKELIKQGKIVKVWGDYHHSEFKLKEKQHD